MQDGCQKQYHRHSCPVVECHLQTGQPTLHHSKSSLYHYFSVGTGTVELVDLSDDSDEEIVTVTESPDGKSSVIKTTFKYSNGNVKTFVAVQTLDENGKYFFSDAATRVEKNCKFKLN